jgi:hypothetical protein
MNRITSFFLTIKELSTDRKFSENVIVKLKLNIFNFRIFFRQKICVGQSHFTKVSFCGKISYVPSSYLNGSSIFSVAPIVNGGTNNIHNSVLSPSLVDDMKALSLGATTNGPTPVVQNVSQYKLIIHFL